MNMQNLTLCSVFDNLSLLQIQSLGGMAQETSYEADEMVYRQGDAAENLFVVIEGRVDLGLKGKNGLEIHIDTLSTGDLFGSCLCFDFDQYALSARCTAPARLLKIGTRDFHNIMDTDPALGFTVQRAISRAYFKRYLETMVKLQNIVGAIVIKAD